MEKEYRRLCGFAKTGLLQPGQREEVTVTFDSKTLASYDEKHSAWIAEKGWYGIWAGNSSRDVALVAVLEAGEDTVIEQVQPICPCREEIAQLSCPEELRLQKEKEWHCLAREGHIPVIAFAPAAQSMPAYAGNPFAQEAGELARRLTDEELTAIVIGEVSKGQGQALGAAGIMVPGAAGETSSALEEKYGVPGVSMADGPAGLRLMKSYEVSTETGEVYSEGILGALEGGLFSSGGRHKGTDIYYQYCTAIPVGTLLAQSFNTELMETVGRAVAEEMQEFHVSWWLAPGMNIHRHPLNGRNFEYFSEDPLLTGKMAAAQLRGMARYQVTGALKHFAANNQEFNRKKYNAVVSERALREIYLKGFEIAVKEGGAFAVMTTYGGINGLWTAGNYDLLTTILRNEWRFDGIAMTDWWADINEEGGEPSIKNTAAMV